MGFINVFIGSNAHINIEHNQLKLTSIDTGEFISYPLVDVNSILIENLRTTISSYCLNQLAKNNIVAYICDETHSPSTYVLSYNSHFKISGVYRLQVSLPKPIKKNIWKNIVSQKIINQSLVLDFAEISNDLKNLASAVRSDDTKNVEGTAAAKYFKLLFGKEFNRDSITNINAALNYGYAIVRGAISRTIVAHGLQPFLGIHHSSQLNNFNLADDFIEPFRPVVDLFVKQNVEKIENGLSTNVKMQLLSLLNCDMLIKGQKFALNNCIEIVVNSYIDCLKVGSAELSLPTIADIAMHKYE